MWNKQCVKVCGTNSSHLFCIILDNSFRNIIRNFFQKHMDKKNLYFYNKELFDATNKNSVIFYLEDLV